MPILVPTTSMEANPSRSDVRAQLGLSETQALSSERLFLSQDIAFFKISLDEHVGNYREIIGNILFFCVFYIFLVNYEFIIGSNWLINTLELIN